MDGKYHYRNTGAYSFKLFKMNAKLFRQQFITSDIVSVNN